MTPFIKRILAFSLLIISAFTILNFFQSLYNEEPEHYKKQYQSIANCKHDYDGIILGTSHATHSIRPTILDESGIRFYNYALNGSNPEFYFKWYNSFIHNCAKKPDFCLFAPDFFMFDKRWLWRKFEQDSEYFPFKLFVNEMIKDCNINRTDLIVNRFPFLKYRQQIKQSLKLEKGDGCFNIKNYDRGYISNSKTFDSTLFKPILNHETDTVQIKYFKLLINNILSDSINLLFIITPEFGIDINDYYQMESLKIIDSIAENYNIPIMNYNIELRSDINQNISWFADWGHMNHEGAKVFSKKLAEDLKALTHDRFSSR